MLALWLDEAVHWFGRWVESMMSQTREVKDGKGNIKHVPKHRIELLLGMPLPMRTISAADFGFL